jgi:hypothetical protein
VQASNTNNDDGEKLDLLLGLNREILRLVRNFTDGSYEIERPS